MFLKIVSEKYYVSRKRKMLREFDKLAKAGKVIFEARFGKEEALRLFAEAHAEYERIIPEIPYIGKSRLAPFLVATAEFLAVYRVLKPRGISAEEAGKMFCDFCEIIMQKYPRFVMRIIGANLFSKRHLEKMRKGAEISKKKEFPEGYVYEFVEGDGKNFDYGVDYLECAGCKFLKKQGEFELAKYLCPMDALYSEKFGWGLVRTKTIADGFDRCDFRFKKGGKTKVAMPECLRGRRKTY
ncbi:MAG: L-2-amino-thiazoline-4-carboxylic acid hydrolase [Candidatus Thermoplasmatota archaeon]|nr:L-2-amino-thiazoline-4-carboxylic acid hydrolase [Candidatus Thermoplasmatota archaeon]